jgi:hypothetical protein
MEKWNELRVLMEELKGKEKVDAEQCTRLFNLHNFFFPDIPEYNRSCPACRERVWKRMVKFWSDKNTQA